jgi:hypothetical protein
MRLRAAPSNSMRFHAILCCPLRSVGSAQGDCMLCGALSCPRLSPFCLGLSHAVPFRPEPSHATRRSRAVPFDPNPSNAVPSRPVPPHAVPCRPVLPHALPCPPCCPAWPGAVPSCNVQSLAVQCCPILPCNALCCSPALPAVPPPLPHLAVRVRIVGGNFDLRRRREDRMILLRLGGSIPVMKFDGAAHGVLCFPMPPPRRACRPALSHGVPRCPSASHAARAVLGHPIRSPTVQGRPPLSPAVLFCTKQSLTVQCSPILPCNALCCSPALPAVPLRCRIWRFE